MAEYRLTKLARANLQDIYEFTDARFGNYPAEAYFEGLRSSFELIAKFDGIGSSADDIRSGWRRFRFQSHFIFYTVESEYALIRALVHVRRNVRPGLFE